MSGPFAVQGRSGYLIVPVVLVPMCAVGAPLYYKDTLPEFCVENAVKVLLAAAGFEAVLLATAAFLAGRRMVLHGATLSLHSWFSCREIAVAAISELTLQTEHSVDSASIDYLVFWGASGQLLRINPVYWDREALSAFVDQVGRINPQIRVARDVWRYLTAN